MTLITFQDGTVVMSDGKVGTEQACCCEPECQCTGSPPEACDIDYIIFTFEFSSLSCDTTLLQEYTLDAAHGWSQQYFLTDGNGQPYYFSAVLVCNDGKYSISFNAATNGGPCFYICNESYLYATGFGRSLPLPSSTYEGSCCPTVAEPWELLFEDIGCFGVRFAVTDMSIVLL